MQIQKGSNIKDVKQSNRMLILRHIAVHAPISRATLSEQVGLSKMAVGNIVSELMEHGLVEEVRPTGGEITLGRPASVLRISRRSPVICGMLIKRGVFQVVIADLSAHVIERRELHYDSLNSAQELIQQLMMAFEELRQRQRRRVLAIGISSIGPLDVNRGVILKPPFFYGISNVEIVSEIRRLSGLPVYLINDANAGALAEKLYGSAQEDANFAYLHIMNGVGLGCVLDNRLYMGNSGQSGEIGHTSINYMGPRCECGNVGCMELYANVKNMSERIKALEKVLGKQSHFADMPSIGWQAIVDAANRGNASAQIALDEFLGYVSCALINLVNLLDFSCVIVGYDSGAKGDIVERLLHARLETWSISSERPVTVRRSAFLGDAPLLGAIACCAERVFDLSLPIME